MRNFEELLELFSKELENYSPATEPANLENPILYTLRIGGKRIRPVLLLMACEAFGQKAEKALPAALGIEIFHNSTLIHDDIMDNADLRRNQPTVFKQWNMNTAILSGDLMIIKAYQEFNRLTKEDAQKTLDVFNRIASQVCEGQQYDLDFETDSRVNLSDYMKMIRLKTSVLLAGAIQIGAIIGGADKEDAKNIYNFGENLGLAFQLQDDLLDSFGVTKTFGKKIGGDITANKKTFLLIKALELAKGAYHDELSSLIGNNKITNDEKVQKVLDIYNKLNIKTVTQDYIIKHFDKAFQYLKKVKIAEKQKTPFEEIAKKLIERQS